MMRAITILNNVEKPFFRKVEDVENCDFGRTRSLQVDVRCCEYLLNCWCDFLHQRR
jgi:hypothetical protein